MASRRHHHARHRPAAHRAVPLYRAALLEYADSGQVLFEQNADMEWPPASMAKMMLLLVAEDQIHAGRLKLTDPVVVSARAAATGGSRLGLRAGQVFPLGELMKAALIRSANDAAVAVAEKVGGSTEGCVRLMNARAQSLGMKNTEYHTVDGLPPTPGHDVDHTTARDLATLARAIIADTDLLRWSELETALFDNGVFVLHNTNHLVGRFPGCDGLKTGFTFHAGFNLTATAKRGDFRIIAVVLGAPSNAQRFVQAGKLLQWGFDNFTPMPVLTGGQRLPVAVRTTSGAVIEPVVAHTVNVAVRRAGIHDIHLRYDIPPLVMAPVRPGAPLGRVMVVDGNEVLGEVAAICPRSTISKFTAAPVASVHTSD
jgi:D-alanyl-D-alanine carboxypeptidase (penicillin-binding protein 5/6)